MTNRSSTKTNETPYTLSSILGEALPRPKALKLIQNDAEAYRIFQELPHPDQEKILGFIQGNQGLKILHDKFSQHVFNPKTHFLSMI
jgi:hypothetical protein